MRNVGLFLGGGAWKNFFRWCTDDIRKESFHSGQLREPLTDATYRRMGGELLTGLWRTQRQLYHRKAYHNRRENQKLHPCRFLNKASSGHLESVLFPAIAAFYIIQEHGFGTVVNFRPEPCKLFLFSESPLQLEMFQYVVNSYTADRELTLYAIQYGSLFNNLEEKSPKVMQCKNYHKS